MLPVSRPRLAPTAPTQTAPARVSRAPGSVPLGFSRAAASAASALAVALAAPRTRMKAEIIDVDIVEVKDPKAEVGEKLVDAVLDLVRKTGVPVRNQVMEYKAEPMRSPLAKAGLDALASGKAATDLLIAGLKARGASEDTAEVAAATLCLMLGGLDEAHNLVTPHSWGAPTTFGGEPKLRSTVSREAKYCHIIIHRMEGENLGEFGSGFNNSRYWLGQAFSYGQSEHPIFPQLRQDAEQLVGSCHDGKVLLRNMGPKWEPSLFNKLCEDALLTEDPEVLEFCKAVQTRELQLLFEHTMTQQQE